MCDDAAVVVDDDNASAPRERQLAELLRQRGQTNLVHVHTEKGPVRSGDRDTHGEHRNLLSRGDNDIPLGLMRPKHLLHTRELTADVWLLAVDRTTVIPSLLTMLTWLTAGSPRRTR